MYGPGGLLVAILHKLEHAVGDGHFVEVDCEFFHRSLWAAQEEIQSAIM